MSFVKRPTRRQVRNQLAGLNTLANGAPLELQAPRKTGPQPENETNKEVAQWRSTKPSVVLERNKRRLATPVGYDKPIMLGWLLPGSADWIGWESVTITPEMVGKRVAVFLALESKRRSGGTTTKEQAEFLDRLRDDGGICGVVRSFEDCDDARRRWRER